MAPDFTSAGKWTRNQVEQTQFSSEVLAQVQALGQPLSIMSYDEARPWFAFPVGIAVDAASGTRTGAAAQWENGYAEAASR